MSWCASRLVIRGDTISMDGCMTMSLDSFLCVHVLVWAYLLASESWSRAKSTHPSLTFSATQFWVDWLPGALSCCDTGSEGEDEGGERQERHTHQREREGEQERPHGDMSWDRGRWDGVEERGGGGGRLGQKWGMWWGMWHTSRGEERHGHRPS